MIAEIIGNVIPNQRVERIVRFVKELENRLGKLEAENLQAKVTDPAVVDLLEDAFIQASRATSEDRITHIDEVIANGITSDELNKAEVKRMLWLLGQLNDAEIVILRSRSRIGTSVECFEIVLIPITTNAICMDMALSWPAAF